MHSMSQIKLSDFKPEDITNIIVLKTKMNFCIGWKFQWDSETQKLLGFHYFYTYTSTNKNTLNLSSTSLVLTHNLNKMMIFQH